jgi:hypothetical protein
VLPVSRDATLHSIYQRLLDVKRTSRDPVAHGYGSEALLVPTERFGLVPVRYAPYARRFYLPWIPIPEESAQGALRAFDEFDAWLDGDATAQYAVLYAKSGFAIPFSEKRTEEIRGWMQSPEVFAAELQKEAEVQDMLQDQWF